MKLIIVESPAKIKKIQECLGSDWKVTASVGHIRDLPQKEMGIEPPNFVPSYEVTEDKKKVVADLKKLVKDASEVYLATDLDREGEAIAFHLKETLNLKTYKRVTFSEITKNAILKAVENPRQIDDAMVAAQESRRVLDRLVGFTVSPALSNQSGITLSAGRVQSPAVRIAVEREREIRNFVKQEFYTVTTTLENGLTLELDAKGWCDNDKHIFDKSVAEAIAENKNYVVSKASIDEKKANPRAPFTTSTLQQAASSLLKMSPKETMKNAQALFEQGAITYHRTDTPNLSAEAFEEIKALLTEEGYDTQDQQLTWSSKENAQEAHEGIRPTNIAEGLVGQDANQKKLYELIRERTLASVMPPAIDVVTSIELSSVEPIKAGELENHAIFKVSGKVEKYAGWRKIVVIEAAKKGAGELPVMVYEGENHTGTNEVKSKSTQPPSRYTEASLVKALDNLGIGRPSTYAAILENITSRGYIQLGTGEGGKSKEMQVVATPLAETLIDAIIKMTFVNLDYTKKLEDDLDLIAHNKGTYLDLVRDVYEVLNSELGNIEIESMEPQNPCPSCKSNLRRIKGSKGYFWGCSNRECGFTCEDDKSKPAETEIHNCPECSKKLNKRKGSNGWFWSCSGYPDCNFSADDVKGVPTARVEKTESCPKCNEPVKQLKSKQKNEFFWVHVQPTENCVKYLSDDKNKPVIKEAAKVEEGGEKMDCPDCKKPMILRVGKWGKFWGCSGYPDCKKTIKVG